MHVFALSVIVPCYNGEEFIDAAIESFLRQSDADMEMIIVNDGSIDQSSIILDRYAKVYDRITVINTKNGGAGRARNIGVQFATGKYCCFLDADDVMIDKCFCADNIKKINTYYQHNIDIIYTPRATADMDFSNYRISYPEDVKDIEHHMPKFEYVFSLYRRKYLSNGIRFAENQEQDIESAFRYRAFSHTDRIIVDRDLLYYIYRMNPNSNTHTWQLQTLYYIKAKVYFELLKETKHDNDKCFLCNVAINNMLAYCKLFVFRGGIDQQRIRLLNKNIRMLFNLSSNDYLTLKMRIKRNICVLLSIICLFRACFSKR